MTHIFYLLLFIFLLSEIFVFGNAERITNRIKEYKLTPQDEKMEYLTKHRNLAHYSTFSIFYWLYVFVGLFSSQWCLFLIIFGMGFIPKRTATIRRIDSVITIAILIFILLNKYHLHINIF